MKRIYVVPMLLVGVFAVSMAMSASAMAVEEVCVKATGNNTGLFMKRASEVPDKCEEELVASDGEFELITFLLAGFLESGGTAWKTEEISATGELTFEDNKAPIVGKMAVLCTATLDGLILGTSEPSHVQFELVLENSTEISSTPLTGTPLLCENVANCGEAEVWPVHLQWLGEIELFEEDNTQIFVLLLLGDVNGNPGWEVKCPLLTDECVSEAEGGIVELKNGSGGAVEAEFKESLTLSAGLLNAVCGGTRTDSGVVTSDKAGMIKTALGGSLTLSSLE
jgi:hypothetical protein